MERTPHGPSCAKRLRVDPIRRHEPFNGIAQTIHDHCAVSRLRAQRLARGLTLKIAAEGLNSLGAGRGVLPGWMVTSWGIGRLTASRARRRLDSCASSMSARLRT